MTRGDGVVSKIGREECWDLLRSTSFGRIGYRLRGRTRITPVNYVVDGSRILFRTAEGSKLLGLTINDDVAFEIDEFSEDLATSVVLRGRARHLEGHEADATDQLPLRPWVNTAKYNVVAIEVDEINGRRFELTRPWLHMRPHDVDE